MNADAVFKLVRQGDAAELASFLSSHANVNLNAKNNKGQTPLYWACELPDPACCELLIQHGADVNVAEQYGFTPLHLSSFMGNERVVSALVAVKADVNKQNSAGCTPLFLAAKKGYKSIVTMLLEHGADPTIANRKGVLPTAICPADSEVYEYLAKETESYQEKVSSGQIVGSSDELQSKLAEAEAKLRCRNCAVANRNTVLLPCMHLLYCQRCAVTVMKSTCKHCKQPVEGYLECIMDE
mmetsp:Transcript_4518/g.11169  ORF Transcript_4518/g.11169 Transcript_4518/m.11169 type:complete len:240 (+) Transcript_4518:32-751(+)